MTSYKEAYKYPFIATEILSSKNKLITDNILINNKEENYILKLIKVLDNKDILNTTIPGYITKIISAHINEDVLYDNIYANKEIIFDIFLKYVYNDSYRDLFYLIFNEAINKRKNEFYDLIPKLSDNLYINMNNYILNESSDSLIELKDGINNIIYIFIKLADNNEEVFNLIINKLKECQFDKKLKENLKNENINNKLNENISFCLNYLLIFISNLLNIIITKDENDIYAFNKYYLSTIYDPPYSLNSNITYNISNIKDTNNKNEDVKDKDVEMKVEGENKNDKINLNQLIDIGIEYLNESNSFFEKYIKILDNINKSVIFSYYDKMTDLIILILKITATKEKEKITNFLNLILQDLIKLIINYPQNSIINNKTLYIFKLVALNDTMIEKSSLVNLLKDTLSQKKLDDLITNEGVISNNDIGNNNNIYLINILNMLEKQDNEKIVKYLQKTNEGLYENEKMEIGDYVPKPDEDEIIFEKKQDIHDTEGFIFTPKKIIEDSKKILKNLKEFDV